AEARFLHAAETELLLLRVDLLVGLVDRDLARHGHAPVIEHLLRHLDLFHLARLEDPVRLPGEPSARPVPALADQEHALLRLDAFEAEQVLAHAPRAGEVAGDERAGDQQGRLDVRRGGLGFDHRSIHGVLPFSSRYRSSTNVSPGWARDTQTWMLRSRSSSVSTSSRWSARPDTSPTRQVPQTPSLHSVLILMPASASVCRMLLSGGTCSVRPARLSTTSKPWSVVRGAMSA